MPKPINSSARAMATFLRDQLSAHHDEIQDCWYSCPKADNYCGEEPRTQCLCGKDARDAEIKVLLAAYKASKT